MHGLYNFVVCCIDLRLDCLIYQYVYIVEVKQKTEDFKFVYTTSRETSFCIFGTTDRALFFVCVIVAIRKTVCSTVRNKSNA